MGLVLAREGFKPSFLSQALPVYFTVVGCHVSTPTAKVLHSSEGFAPTCILTRDLPQCDQVFL